MKHQTLEVQEPNTKKKKHCKVIKWKEQMKWELLKNEIKKVNNKNI